MKIVIENTIEQDEIVRFLSNLAWYIKLVAIDMWNSYKLSIVIAKIHIVKSANKTW